MSLENEVSEVPKYALHDRDFISRVAASHRGCTINATDCMYSKLPPEDEQLIYSKHVEDIYWNKFKNKVHLVGSYYANLSLCTVHIMSNS
jgi:hypothetical protein